MLQKNKLSLEYTISNEYATVCSKSEGNAAEIADNLLSRNKYGFNITEILPKM